jgi:hypothetical protein
MLTLAREAHAHAYAHVREARAHTHALAAFINLLILSTGLN